MATDPSKEALTSELLRKAGVEKSYSTKEAAVFFDRSDQWVYWVLRMGLTDPDTGERLEARREGRARHRRFSLDVIEKLAVALYNRGTMTEDHLRDTLLKIAIARRS